LTWAGAIAAEWRKTTPPVSSSVACGSSMTSINDKKKKPNNYLVV
jgi:hypothetical protein